MRANAELLVIGPDALGSAIGEALPRCKSTATADLLSGIWRVGHHDYDGVIISYSFGQRVLNAIESLRDVAPHLRIVVALPPADEPNASQTLAAGADDYILEPVTREDLERALQIASPPPPVEAGPPVPSVEEVVGLSTVLQRLSEGLEPTLKRLGDLLRSAFGAAGATLHVDDVAVAVGEPTRPVLQEPLRQNDQPVGSIGLGPRRGGTYQAHDAHRLREYGRLIETIVAQVRDRQHWQELAWRDDLTGLHNRRYFDNTLQDLVRRAQDQRRELSVALLDIDNFKTYNDTYGHDTGDALLKEVAALLVHCSRDGDIVARYGGDELAIILWDEEEPRVPGSRHPSDAQALAERFREAIASHEFRCLGQRAPGPVTISGGMASYPWDGNTPVELLKAADDALLEAKRNGKGRIQLANGCTRTRGQGSRMDIPDAASADAVEREEEPKS